MKKSYIYLILNILYIIFQFNNKLISQSTVKVTFHDASSETYYLSASGKIVSESSVLNINIHSTASTISIPLVSVRKIAFASFSFTDENPDIDGFSVFPNPADQYFIIRSNNHSLLDLSLVNILGQQVLSGKFYTEERISVVDLDPGIYVLQVNGCILKLILQ